MFLVTVTVLLLLKTLSFEFDWDLIYDSRFVLSLELKLQNLSFVEEHNLTSLQQTPNVCLDNAIKNKLDNKKEKKSNEIKSNEPMNNSQNTWQSSLDIEEIELNMDHFYNS